MKYIYIDSNQYRHIYSSSEGFSQEVYDLLMRLTDREDHAQLLLPQQTKDEVERNRFRPWPEAEESDISSKIEKLAKRIESIKSEYGEYSGIKYLLKNLESEKSNLEKESHLISKRFISVRSKQNQKIKKLFDKAQILPESTEITTKAQIRLAKGNPPYTKDKKIGDLLIWESLLSYLGEKKNQKPQMIFVSNDKVAWGRNQFDPWLESEYKNITQGNIFFSNRLSDIPDLTTEEQEKIRKEEEENLKKNAITDFVSSQSFVSAGSNAQRLLSCKNFLNEDDYRKILMGSVSNHEIYQSFFTPTTLKELIEGENGYVVRQVEVIPSELWERFEKRYQTGLKRQSSENTSDPIESINSGGIPF